MADLAHDIVMGLRAAMALLAVGVFLRVIFNPASIPVRSSIPDRREWRRWSMLLLMGGLAGISLAHLAAMTWTPLFGTVFYDLFVIVALAAVTAGITMVKIWVTMNNGCPAIYAWPIGAIPLVFVLVALLGTTS